MKATRSSTTAEQMALSRAIETRKPAGERICCDPLAERFLDAKYRMLLWGRPFRDVVERLIEQRFAGHHYYVIARTRYFDDLLQQRLAGGAEQLVILGAGPARPGGGHRRIGGRRAEVATIAPEYAAAGVIEPQGLTLTTHC